MDGVRVCAVCGAALVRRPGEQPNRFAKRRTCSKKCQHSFIAASLRRRGDESVGDQTCAACGSPLVRRDDELPSAFRVRRACSQECAKRLRGETGRTHSDDKSCAVCGCVIVRRRAESARDFTERKTCGTVCAHSLSRTGSRRRQPKGPAEKRCATCAAPLVRRVGETTAKWEVRITCGGQCGRRVAEESIAETKAAKNPIIDKSCAACGKPFARRIGENTQHYRKRVTCSPACRWAATAASNRDPRPSRTCVVCKKEFWIDRPPSYAKRVACSEECRFRLTLTRHTSIEVAVEAALDALGVEYESQRCISPYVVDFLIPGTMTVVEAYGDYWHANPRRFPDPVSERMTRQRKRDRKRAAYLERRGYRVVILWEWDIWERGAARLVAESLAA